MLQVSRTLRDLYGTDMPVTDDSYSEEVPVAEVSYSTRSRSRAH